MTEKLIPLFLSLAVAALLLLAASVWRAGGAYQQQACVAKVMALYPAVPVSAVNGKATGPLKLSYAVERQRAVKDC